MTIMVNLGTQSIRCTVFGASRQKFMSGNDLVCNIYLHTYGPVEGELADQYKGNAYSRLTCEESVFERLKLPAQPQELELLVRLMPGSKNSMKLHVVDIRGQKEAPQGKAS